VNPPVPDSDDHLREHPLDSEQVFKGKLLDVRRDHVRLPDGSTATREYIKHSGAVLVVPILDDGSLVVERQYRYPLSRVMLEFPAGKIDPGESTLTCAVRELAEETGYRAAEWAHAGVLHNAIAYSDEGIHIFFARGLSRGEQKLDDGEFLELVTHTVEDLDRMAVSGELTDAKTLIGLLLLRRSRYGAGLTVRDALLATSLLVAGNSVVFTHLPVTADRSISVFMLAYMDSTDGSLSSADIEDVVVTEYVRERGAIDKRLDEQIVSGNIEKVGDRYRITDQGRGLMRLYRAIAALYGVDPTNLSP